MRGGLVGYIPDLKVEGTSTYVPQKKISRTKGKKRCEEASAKAENITQLFSCYAGLLLLPLLFAIPTHLYLSGSEKKDSWRNRTKFGIVQG